MLSYDIPEAMWHDKFKKLPIPLREDEQLEVLCPCNSLSEWVGKVAKEEG